MLSRLYLCLNAWAAEKGPLHRMAGWLLPVVEGLRWWRKDRYRAGVPGAVHWIRRFARAGRRPVFDQREVPVLYGCHRLPGIGGPDGRARFSILMPVCNTDPGDLREAIASVIGQSYGGWELCIVDDGSTSRQTIDVLERISDPRIRIERLSMQSGISAATNRAFAISRHEWIALLDHDDVLHPCALSEMARAIAEHPDADVLYSDEDKIDPAGFHKAPFYKPGFSPDLLRSQNYLCHFLAIRASKVASLGGWRSGFDGAQDHDLLLRLLACGCRFYHVPLILYHWRQSPNSTAMTPFCKPGAHLAGMRSADEHAKAVFGTAGHAEETGIHFVYNVRSGLLTDRHRISIVIPTRDHLQELRTCIESIRDRSTWKRYEILVLDNASTDSAMLAWIGDESRKDPERIRILRVDEPFNWSRLNNIGIRNTRGDVIVLLNNDTEVLTADWLERLADEALRPDVGAVGPLLLYPDGGIQHAGVVVGMGGWADHVFKGHRPVHDISPFVSPMVKRNVLAVSGACMAFSRSLIERIGYLDERFTMCGSDVEFCIRASEAGLWNVYDPAVRLVHHEACTRKSRPIPENDFTLSRQVYAPYLSGRGDPFYNPHLSLMDTTPMVHLP